MNIVENYPIKNINQTKEKYLINKKSFIFLEKKKKPQKGFIFFSKKDNDNLIDFGNEKNYLLECNNNNNIFFIKRRYNKDIFFNKTKKKYINHSLFLLKYKYFLKQNQKKIFIRILRKTKKIFFYKWRKNKTIPFFTWLHYHKYPTILYNIFGFVFKRNKISSKNKEYTNYSNFIKQNKHYFFNINLLKIKKIVYINKLLKNINILYK